MPGIAAYFAKRHIPAHHYRWGTRMAGTKTASGMLPVRKHRRKKIYPVPGGTVATVLSAACPHPAFRSASRPEPRASCLVRRAIVPSAGTTADAPQSDSIVKDPVRAAIQTARQFSAEGFTPTSLSGLSVPQGASLHSHQRTKYYTNSLPCQIRGQKIAAQKINAAGFAPRPFETRAPECGGSLSAGRGLGWASVSSDNLTRFWWHRKSPPKSRRAVSTARRSGHPRRFPG